MFSAPFVSLNTPNRPSIGVRLGVIVYVYDLGQREDLFGSPVASGTAQGARFVAPEALETVAAEADGAAAEGADVDQVTHQRALTGTETNSSHTKVGPW